FFERQRNVLAQRRRRVRSPPARGVVGAFVVIRAPKKFRRRGKNFLCWGTSALYFPLPRLDWGKGGVLRNDLPPAAFFLGWRGSNGALWCQHHWKGRCQDGSTRTRCGGDQWSKSA